MDIGIDLGTTFSVVAVAGRPTFAVGYPAEGEYIEECNVTIIWTPESEATVPSALWQSAESASGYIIGMEAKQAAESGCCPVMWSKRKIGTTETLRCGARSMTAKEVATELLKHLKSLAEQALGQPVRRAVVTHPAYFDRNQVEETREAADKAGFDMSLTEQMLMEPVAAALAYTKSDVRDPLRIMIYDLGGGTFDVTILERKGGVISCKAFAGDHLLGGYDFDRKLANWIRDQLRAKGRIVPYDENNPEDRGRQARLLTYAESLKVRLADMGRHKKVPIDVQPDFLVDEQGKKIQVREHITQEQFVALIHDELESTIECCNRCLAKAGMSVTDLDYVLLVGGSTHGPWIEELVRERFGIEPQRFRPDLCVAAGAAIHAESLPPGLLSGEEVEARINASPKSVLPTVPIGGQLKTTLPGLTVLLQTPQGQTLGPLAVGEDKTFLFEHVDLLEEGPTEFTLQVIDANGTSHLKHHFLITYEPEGSVREIQTVLPKPLYLRGLSGMRPLALEGQMLPSDEITVELERLHSESFVTVPIYQGDEDNKAVEIRITDIPAEAGEGAKLILKVRITEKNEIKGTAQVFSARSRRLLNELPVRVTFPPTEVPTKAKLEEDFRRLEDERTQKIVMEDDAVRRTLLENKGQKLAQQIERMLAGPDADRQKIDSLLREFKHLVNPPDDDMSPKRADFDYLISQCRDTLEAMPDGPQKEAFARLVSKNEQEGRDAFVRKDPRKWGAINDSLGQLQQKLKGGDGPKPVHELPPTEILKDQAMMEIDLVRASLESTRDSLSAKDPEGYANVFKNRCDEVERMLDQMENKVRAIKDESEPRQALGQVQLALRPLPQARKKMSGIVVDFDLKQK